MRINTETHRISDFMPANSEFALEGQFSVNGQFAIDCIHASRIGDLFHSGLEMTSDFGNCDISVLGHKNYIALRETYLYKQGMICSARIKQPFIGLFFQLEGATQTRALHSSMDLKLDIYPGEANLMITPPLDETFELKEELGGRTFTIMLTKGYLQDLANRYPTFMEPILAKVNRKDFCMFKEQNMRITPRMYAVIQRINNQDASHITGSLFLEAQILDLLSLMFSQPEQPVSSNGHSLSRSDRERIYRVRELLMERVENPPTLAELSRLVGTNEYKLKRGFKEIFGTSPYAYHLEHKLELARSYVLDTDLTIAEIAYKVGYSDPAHLTNAFRKQYGIPPSDLR